MGLKINTLQHITSGQKINNLNKPANTANPNNFRNGNQSVTDKQAQLNYTAAQNKLKLQNAFSQQTVQPQENNKEINGINTESNFTMPVGKDETQESVLRRTYGEMAKRAGLSDEKKPVTVDGQERQLSGVELFVEERLKSNREEVKTKTGRDENRIFNADTGNVFSDTEFGSHRTGGSIISREGGQITMNPTESDIEQLKNVKASQDYAAGEKVADELEQAFANRGTLDKWFGEIDSSTEPGKALEKIKANRDNGEFQSGLINRLGADKFLKFEQMLNGNKNYGDVLRNSLVTVGNNEANYANGVEHEPSISGQIAKKAGIEQLVRLAGEGKDSLSKDSLVEAGKRIIKPEIAWNTETLGQPSSGFSNYRDRVTADGYKVLAAISRSPEASSELMQNEDFVRNGLRMSNINGSAGKIFAQIIRNGATDAQGNSSEDNVKSLEVLSKVLREDGIGSNDTSRIPGETVGLADKQTKISPEIADVLADVYANNIEKFSQAAGLNDEGNFNSEDTSEILRALQPHHSIVNGKGESVGDRLAQATAKEYTKLLQLAEKTGDSTYAERAANLAGDFINGNGKANVENAKAKDERSKRFVKALSIIGEVATVAGGKGISDIGSKIAGKIVAVGTETNGKTNNAENAEEENLRILRRQQTTNSATVVQVFEQGAYDRVSGKQESNPQEKMQAENFLADLKVYNESLPASGKILDQNGRLINPAQMTGSQRQSLESIFSGNENLARRSLAQRMNAVRDSLNNATERKIH